MKIAAILILFSSSFALAQSIPQEARDSISFARYQTKKTRAPEPKSDSEIINDLYSPFNYRKVGRVLGRNYYLCCKRYGSGVSAQVDCHYCN